MPGPTKKASVVEIGGKCFIQEAHMIFDSFGGFIWSDWEYLALTGDLMYPK